MELMKIGFPVVGSSSPKIVEISGEFLDGTDQKSPFCIHTVPSRLQIPLERALRSGRAVCEDKNNVDLFCGIVSISLDEQTDIVGESFGLAAILLDKMLRYMPKAKRTIYATGCVIEQGRIGGVERSLPGKLKLLADVAEPGSLVLYPAADQSEYVDDNTLAQESLQQLRDKNIEIRTVHRLNDLKDLFLPVTQSKSEPAVSAAFAATSLSGSAEDVPVPRITLKNYLPRQGGKHSPMSATVELHLAETVHARSVTVMIESSVFDTASLTLNRWYLPATSQFWQKIWEFTPQTAGRPAVQFTVHVATAEGTQILEGECSLPIIAHDASLDNARHTMLEINGSGGLVRIPAGLDELGVGRIVINNPEGLTRLEQTLRRGQNFILDIPLHRNHDAVYPAPEPADCAFIRWQDDAAVRISLLCSKTAPTLGRNGDLYWLPYPLSSTTAHNISRQHVTLSWSEQGLAVQDCSSVGTWLNDERLPQNDDGRILQQDDFLGVQTGHIDMRWWLCRLERNGAYWVRKDAGEAEEELWLLHPRMAWKTGETLEAVEGGFVLATPDGRRGLRNGDPVTLGGQQGTFYIGRYNPRLSS